ncbi:heterokaryon incompatibility protein-domain-containing protein [Xylaria sp. FL0043]|nr:heterokaryon incompatibility protein-domain-containing protein [Xylaria sp. FL0043]
MRRAETGYVEEGTVDDYENNGCKHGLKVSERGNVQCSGVPTLRPSSAPLTLEPNECAQILDNNTSQSIPVLPREWSTLNGPSVVASPSDSDEGPLVRTTVNHPTPMRRIDVGDMLDVRQMLVDFNRGKWYRRKRWEWLERQRRVHWGSLDRQQREEWARLWIQEKETRERKKRDMERQEREQRNMERRKLAVKKALKRMNRSQYVALSRNRHLQTRNSPWVEDAQQAIPLLIWEPSWLEGTSGFPRRLPWTVCTMKDCVLPNGHRAPHELWKPCEVKGCLRYQNHDGDHRMRNEELRDAAVRLEKESQAAARYWKDLADMVLEAMGYPQPEGRWISKMAKTEMSPVKNTTMKASIPPPSFPQRGPLTPYRRLVLDNQHIRLFQLNPGTTTSGITGSFICAELSPPPAYTALSYTWGDMETGRKITITNQGQLTVGDNLWSFLCVQSSTITQPTSFWIDAICIDQSNVHERNHQVGLMKQIYANATKVYVWLGREAENSDIAMRFVTAQAAKPLRSRGPGYYPLWTRQQGDALQILCERPYWRRMWIIQELLHAEDITVWCGSLHFSWGDMEKLYLKLKTVEEANWFAHHEFHMKIMQSSAAVMMWQRAHWRHPDTPVPRLPTLIKIFRDWRCTDLRDKVFALSGMATEESTVIPDYALTVREVYLAVMQNVERKDKEQFGTLLSQILGLPGRDIELPGQNMYFYSCSKTSRPHEIMLI